MLLRFIGKCAKTYPIRPRKKVGGLPFRTPGGGEWRGSVGVHQVRCIPQSHQTNALDNDGGRLAKMFTTKQGPLASALILVVSLFLDDIPYGAAESLALLRWRAPNAGLQILAALLLGEKGTRLCPVLRTYRALESSTRPTS